MVFTTLKIVPDSMATRFEQTIEPSFRSSSLQVLQRKHAEEIDQTVPVDQQEGKK